MKPSFRTVLLCALIGLMGSAVFAQTPQASQGLQNGKYAIGYKTLIDVDYSRTYNLNYPHDTSSQKHDPRPIVITLWYPAKPGKQDKPMVYGDYIKLPRNEPTLKTFLERLEVYNKKNSALYMFFEDSLKQEQSQQFDAHLKKPIPVYRDATPVDGKFPLVIYHAGLGGTLNDNTLLCEYLASHGFVVMTGAFQSNDYKDMDLDWDLERSTKDLDFMLNKVTNLSFIDFTKIAAIGHSYGAQAVLGYRTEDFSPVSWLIIIDSTIDYFIVANPRGFELLTSKLYRKRKNMSVPMLVFANPHAAFTVLDSLTYSDRIYCTIQLEHNDFTSLTTLSKRDGLLKQDDSNLVWEKYQLMANYCLNYLRSVIYHDPQSRQFVMSKRPLSDVYEVPKNTSLRKLTPPYTDYTKAPSYHQLNAVVISKDKDALDTIGKLYPDMLNSDMINNAGYSMLREDTEYAIYLFKKNVDAQPKSWNAWDSLGEGYMVKGDKSSAIACYTKSLELNPKNRNASFKLEQLNKQGPATR